MSAVQQLISSYGALVDFNLNAVDFDGSTEYMANTTQQALGFANAWTVSSWFNVTSFATNARVIFQVRNGSGAVSLIQIATNTSGKITVITFSSAAAIIKSYVSSVTVSTGTKYHFVTTWDGTNLKLYFNATEDTTPTKSTDGSGTMGNDNRSVDLGSDRAGTQNFFSGTIAKTDIWNTALSGTEITALYDSGNGYKLDVRNSKGNYTSTANLVHQWAPGKDGTTITTMGTDYVSSGTINIGTNAANISSADIVTF